MACEDRRGKIEAALRRACPKFRVGEIHEFEDDEIPDRTGKRHMGGCFVRFERVHNMFGLWHREAMICDVTIKDPVALESWLRDDVGEVFMRAVGTKYRRTD